MEIIIAKANPIGEESAVPDVVIRITGALPKVSGESWRAESTAFYTSEANKLASALYAGLPGATVEHLTAELLRRLATLYTGRLVK